MTGIFIQQITLIELESSIRKIVQEELLSLSISTDISKLPDSLDDTLLSKNEAAKLLRVSLPTFTKMIKEGRVRPYRIGKRFKFKKDQILSSINSK